MFGIKTEVLRLKAQNIDSKKHILYFPGNMASFRDIFECSGDYNRNHHLRAMKSDKIFSEEALFSNHLGSDIEELRELCGDGIFISQVDDYNFHFINHHSRSLQRSMLTYLHYTLLFSAIVFSSVFFVKASYRLAIGFAIIAVMCCFVSLVSYIMERSIDKLTGISNFMKTGNLIRFFVKPQDPIDAGVAYVYQLLEDGVDPSDIILHGFSWGAHVATEVSKSFEGEGVYFTLINNTSFGSPPLELGEKCYGKWVTLLAKLLRVNYNFNPLETVKKSRNPIYMIQKIGDKVIPSKFSLVELYKKSREEKSEDPGYKVTACFREKTLGLNNHNKALSSFDYFREEAFSNKDIFKKIGRPDNEDVLKKIGRPGGKTFCDQVRPYLKLLNENYEFDNIDNDLSKPHIKFVYFYSCKENSF